MGPQLPTSIILTITYAEVHPGSSQMPICLRNLSAYSTVVPAKVVIRKVGPANQVPPIILLTRTSEESVCDPWKDWILNELSLQGLEDWPEDGQKQARGLLTRWKHLFIHSDIDLGKTSLIKHQIKFTDKMPFRECYQWILPHTYDDVKANLQEMLNIGAIWKLLSPWDSTLVLVQKKGGSLRFCINLRKLNNHTIKDDYSLPHIDETLDSLQGSQWFFLLDLKSRYWQVEMGKESKQLTCVHSRAIVIPWIWPNAFQTDQCPCHLSATNGRSASGTSILIGV